MALLSQTAANVIASAQAIAKDYVAGAALTAGMVVYKDTANGNVIKPTDHTNSNPIARAVLGIAMNSAATGQPVRVCTQDLGGLNIGATVVPTEPYTTSGTSGSGAAGGIQLWSDSTAGDYPTVIGVGNSTTTIIFNPVGLPATAHA